MDYLADHYQRVFIHGQKSGTGLIKTAVPEGANVGPLLFLIYSNEHTNIIQCKIKLFADGTSLYIEFDNPTLLVK